MTGDVMIRGARIVQPGSADPVIGDLVIRDGQIAAVGDVGDTGEGLDVLDASGLLAFPGVVDAHQHWGIYNPLDIDAQTESRACAQGGVTTGLSYIRTGQYYLNRGGSYADFLAEALRLAEGNAHVDYGFHVAPMQRSHIDEIPALVAEHGIASFKIFMFYGSHGLHGRSDDQSSFLMTPPGESYDYAHFEFVMRGVQRARELMPDIAEQISLSLHCETAEIMAAYTKMVEEEGELKGLEAYSASRPPHSEGLAIAIAAYLAHTTDLPTINLLHLSGAAAMESAMLMATTFPHIDFRREVTIGHLLTTYDSAAGLGGKVNPPLRSRADREALWQHVLAGDVDWVVSDHACCRDEMKFGEDRDDVFLAKSGFGGTEYLLSGLITEGRRRGLGYGAIAQLTAANPAARFGLGRKGRLAVGMAGDVALVDPDSRWTVRAADSESTQEYTPFEGFDMDARVVHTVLAGRPVFRDGQIVGAPQGRFLHRPTATG